MSGRVLTGEIPDWARDKLVNIQMAHETLSITMDTGTATEPDIAGRDVYMWQISTDNWKSGVRGWSVSLTSALEQVDRAVHAKFGDYKRGSP